MEKTIMTRVEIKEDVRIPGTNILLEKGDQIVVSSGKEKMKEASSGKGRGLSVKKVVITKDVKIPGTNVILEKGDKVTIKGKLSK